MPAIPYSAAKADLFTPWKRGQYFDNHENQSTASLCAELSRLAYCRKSAGFAFDTDQIQSVLQRIGFSNAAFIESAGAAVNGGTHCFTAVGSGFESGTRIGVVVFRGTDADDPTDIGSDADLILTAWPQGGLVHAGFSKGFDSVRKRLDDEIQAINSPLVFTGHSLGAALATLAASRYRQFGKDVVLYTFGSPLVGNAEFVATLDNVSSYRYRDCCDIVTRVPPPELGYAHVGPPRYVDRNGRITLGPTEAEIAEDRAAAECDYLVSYAWKTGNVGVRDLADHSPINYVWRLTADNA